MLSDERVEGAESCLMHDMLILASLIPNVGGVSLLFCFA
jgi:hypothetical protein